MYCVGLTGNIASGKSSALACFQARGVAVIMADAIAKELTAINQPAFHRIVEHFGQRIITTSGDLNRRLLRDIIFNNRQERLWLEQLLHPLIKQAIEQNVAQQQAPYCVIEIPLLKNRHDYPYLDRILVILADKTTQITRVMTRDHCDEQQALTILATQPNDEDRIQLADDIVSNNGSIMQLECNIAQLHKEYLYRAENSQQLVCN